MKNLIIGWAFLIASSVYASGDHGHSHGDGHSHGHGHSHSHGAMITKKQSEEFGRKHVERLIKDGKIDPSWKSSTYDKSIKKKFGKSKEWVVTFDNKKGVKGKKLFIFLKESGEFVAANFTGN